MRQTHLCASVCDEPESLEMLNPQSVSYSLHDLTSQCHARLSGTTQTCVNSLICFHANAKEGERRLKSCVSNFNASLGSASTQWDIQSIAMLLKGFSMLGLHDIRVIATLAELAAKVCVFNRSFIDGG